MRVIVLMWNTGQIVRGHFGANHSVNVSLTAGKSFFSKFRLIVYMNPWNQYKHMLSGFNDAAFFPVIFKFQGMCGKKDMQPEKERLQKNCGLMLKDAFSFVSLNLEYYFAVVRRGIFFWF